MATEMTTYASNHGLTLEHGPNPEGTDHAVVGSPLLRNAAVPPGRARSQFDRHHGDRWRFLVLQSAVRGDPECSRDCRNFGARSHAPGVAAPHPPRRPQSTALEHGLRLRNQPDVARCRAHVAQRCVARQPLSRDERGTHLQPARRRGTESKFIERCRFGE